MFDIKEIIRLIKVFEESANVGELKMKYKEFELSLRKRGEGQQNVVVPVATQQVQAPLPAPQPVQQPKETTPSEKPQQEETQAEESDKKLYELRSPMVGTFYRRPDPESPPYVEVGDKVKKGDVVCIIEAMKLFNEIKSDVSGTIRKILVEDQDPVEFEQVLFLIELDE